MFGGNDLAEAVKPKHGVFLSAVMQYGGNFLAVGGFHLSAVTTLAEAEKTKYDGIFPAEKQYGGKLLAVSSFSFFSGNVKVNSKLGGNFGA